MNDSIRNYIRNTISPEEQKQLQKAAENENQLALLLELIDFCREQTKNSEPITYTSEISSDQFEDIMSDVLAKNISIQDAQLFLQQLEQNPATFERAKLFLALATTPMPNKDDTFYDIEIQSDADLLDLVIKQTKRVQNTSKQSVIKKYLNSFAAAFTNFKRPVPRWAAVAVVLSIVAMIFILPDKLDNDVYRQYFHPSIDPYYSKISNTLRSNQSDFDLSNFSNEKIQQMRGFKNRYELGIASYLLKDYKDAIQQFAECEKDINFFENDTTRMVLVRDLYFYQGLSFLALAGEKTTRKNYLEKAIKNIKTARTIEKNYYKIETEETTFFLGLSLFLNREEQTAYSYLKQISESSSFYQQAEYLIKKYRP